MSEDVVPVTIELAQGYADKQGKQHRRVTFGRRVSGKELFAIGDDPQPRRATPS
jgi:hypothetical protein